jgi:hypothetical protein
MRDQEEELTNEHEDHEDPLQDPIGSRVQCGLHLGPESLQGRLVPLLPIRETPNSVRNLGIVVWCLKVPNLTIR